MYKYIILGIMLITSVTFGGLEETIAQYLAKNNELLQEQNEILKEIRIAIKALAAAKLEQTGDLSSAMASSPKSAFNWIADKR